MFENMKRLSVFFALFVFAFNIHAEDKRVYSENDFINIFSGKPKARFLKYLGEQGYKATMTCRWDRLPEGVPKTAFHYMKGVKVDHRTRVARFEQSVVAVKHVTHPTGSGKKDYTLTHVSLRPVFVSTGALGARVCYGQRP